MNDKLRILLVANSVPLPATDFLKDKLMGLSGQFDLHFICWDSEKNRDEFYSRYAGKLPAKNIHLFYENLDWKNIIKLSFQNIARALFAPHISWPLLYRLGKAHNWNIRKIFTRFSLYFPILALRPGIVHFEYGTLAHRFSDIKDYINCKTTVSFRGYDINYTGLEDQDYYRQVWQNFDGFHFLGGDLKKRALKRGYRPSKNEVLIPPGIDTGFFSPSGNPKADDKFIIVSVGRLAWKKGYEYGLQAVAGLKNRGISVEYRIIANGTYRQPLLFAISELSLEQNVRIIPAHSADEVRQHLDEAHVFLHPAISEGFSNAVLEAQAMQLPVVTTNADGLPENVEDGITGFVVPVYDATAMTERLEWCYNNRPSLQTMGTAGRQRVLKYFTIEEQLEKFAAFYSQLNDE